MTFALYLGGALAFSAAAVLALGTALEFERRWGRLMVPALYLLILGYACSVPLLSARDLLAPEAFAQTGGAAKWLMRLVLAGMLGMCVARMVGAAFSRENDRVGGAALFFAFGVYFLTTVVMNGALGTHPEFRHEYYYVLFFFAAVYASRSYDPEAAVRFAKVGLFAFVAASWAALLVAPDMVLEHNYPSWIPGVSVRFWGLANHANSMAPLALAYLLLALHQPFRRRWLQQLGVVLGLAALLAAQSKTTWSAAALALPLLMILRSGAWRGAKFALLGLGIAVAGALLVLPMLGVSLEGWTDSPHGKELMTLDGRDDIWALALYEWRRNPLFGYGPAMWDSAYRLEVGLEHAVSAHNQFLQTLSVAGAIGAIGLAVYLGALSLYAMRAWRASHGLSVALLVVTLVRCATETPLTVDSPLSGDFVAQLLLFQVALAYGSRSRGVERQRHARSG